MSSHSASTQNAKGILANLEKLEMEDYGAGFRLYRNGMPLDESTAREAFVRVIADPAFMERYQDEVQAMHDAGDTFYLPVVRLDPDGLTFEHGDFSTPIVPADAEIAGPAKTRRNRGKGRPPAVERNRAGGEANEGDYLAHANQSGYLMANVRLRIMRSKNMRTSSVKMKVLGMTMGQLRRITDIGGAQSLAGLSTHEGQGVDEGVDADSDWAGFAREIVDFLGLDMAVDIDALASQYRDIFADTGYRSLEEWSADVEVVIKHLIVRRPDIDAKAIRNSFMKGYDENELKFAAPA